LQTEKQNHASLEEDLDKDARYLRNNIYDEKMMEDAIYEWYR